MENQPYDHATDYQQHQQQLHKQGYHNPLPGPSSDRRSSAYGDYRPAAHPGPAQSFAAGPQDPPVPLPPPPGYTNQPSTPSWHQPNWNPNSFHQSHHQQAIDDYAAYQHPIPNQVGLAAGLTGREAEYQLGLFDQNPNWDRHPPPPPPSHNDQHRRNSIAPVSYRSYQSDQLAEMYQRQPSLSNQLRAEHTTHYSPTQPQMHPMAAQPHSAPQYDSLGLGVSPSPVGLAGPAELSGHSYLSRAQNDHHLAGTLHQPPPPFPSPMMPPPSRPCSVQPPLSINTHSAIEGELDQGPYSAAARLSGYAPPTPLQPGMAPPGTYSPVDSPHHLAARGPFVVDWRRQSLIYDDRSLAEAHPAGSAASTPSLRSVRSTGSSASVQNLSRSRQPSLPNDYQHGHTSSPAIDTMGLYEPHRQAGSSSLAPVQLGQPAQPPAAALTPPPSSMHRPSRSSSVTGITLAEVDPSLPIVRRATEQRRLMSGMPTSAHPKKRSLLDPVKAQEEGEFAASQQASPSLPEPKVIEKGGKVTINMSVACWRCASPLAGLTLRGSRSQFAEAYHAAYFCLGCGPLDEPESDPDEKADEKADGADFLTYEYTFSAALDRLQGLTIEPDDTRPKAVRSSRPAPAGSKRKKDDAHLQCDVCMRTIGSGGVYLSERRELVEFQIEVICLPCSQRYRRCSDCGGGGGPRLGVGKWRCRELFLDGRRNCILSHHRQGADQEQAFDVWPMRDVPRHELDELVEQCRNLYSQAMMAMIANPELLEAHKPLARSFAEVLKISGDWWSAFLPSFHDDIEPSTGIRRYLGLRWSSPALRKKAKAKQAGAGAGAQGPGANEDEGEDEGEWGRPETVIRKGKVLSSYIVAEWDVYKGSFFVSLVMPKGTGHTYDANTTLMAQMTRRAERDALTLHALNPRVPLLTEVWTMLLVVKESHFLNRDGARRGFVPLEDYVADGGDPAHFPPHREVYLPAEFLKGWRVMARRWWPGAELAPPAQAKARKRKPAPAQARGEDPADSKQTL